MTKNSKDPSEHSPPSVESPPCGTTTVRCSNCETDVQPGGKGHCPACGRFLAANVAALVHGGRRISLPPERASRRAELKAKVWAELGGNPSPIVAEVAEDFVSVCMLRGLLGDHLEAVGPLTQRGTRRAAVDLYFAASARMERGNAQLAPHRKKIDGYDAAHLAQVPTSALMAADDLYARQAAGEILTERELGALQFLESALQGTLILPADPEPDRTAGKARRLTNDSPSGPSPDPTDAPGLGPLGALPSGEDLDRPEPATCPYCGKSPNACEALRTERPDVFFALHPEAREADRAERATREMTHFFGIPTDGGDA